MRRHEVVFSQKNETHIGRKEKDSFLHSYFSKTKLNPVGKNTGQCLLTEMKSTC